MIDTRLNSRFREIPAKYIINGLEATVFNVSAGGALIEKVSGTMEVGDCADGKFVRSDGKEFPIKASILRVQERSIALKFGKDNTALLGFVTKSA